MNLLERGNVPFYECIAELLHYHCTISHCPFIAVKKKLFKYLVWLELPDGYDCSIAETTENFKISIFIRIDVRLTEYKNQISTLRSLTYPCPLLAMNDQTRLRIGPYKMFS